MISAITVLALGIGVNTAVFTLVDTLFFAPPAYAKPHEMVQLFSQDKKDPKKFRGFSYPIYLDIREQNTVFSDVMGFNVAFIGLGQKGDTRRASVRSLRRTISLRSAFRWPEAAHFYRKRKLPATTRRSRSSLQLLAEARPRSKCARLAFTDQRSLVHDRGSYAQGFRRHDANSCRRKFGYR